MFVELKGYPLYKNSILQVNPDAQTECGHERNGKIKISDLAPWRTAELDWVATIAAAPA
jgi:hypothetical protein